MITIPTSAFRTVQTVPESVLKAIGTITVHGLLAAELATDTSDLHAPWRAALPSNEYIKESMPFMWPNALHALLPPASMSLLENQQKKLSLDWASVSTAFPSLPYDLYLYNWFIVGTRTFYFPSPDMEKGESLDPDECLALVPFADYFNHADAGCEVILSPTGYQICADRQIRKGNEIFFSYGNHSNDFLLVEYGFILTENKWDEISLDGVILPLFSEKQKESLEKADILGGFVLDKKMACYRTQVALRLLCMPLERWCSLVANGLEEGDKDQTASDGLLLKALNSYLDIVHERLQQVSVLDHSLSSQKELLRRRWEQIGLLLANAVSRIED